jgi:hypothetical protein
MLYVSQPEGARKGYVFMQVFCQRSLWGMIGATMTRSRVQVKDAYFHVEILSF